MTTVSSSTGGNPRAGFVGDPAAGPFYHPPFAETIHRA